MNRDFLLGALAGGVAGVAAGAAAGYMSRPAALPSAAPDRVPRVPRTRDNVLIAYRGLVMRVVDHGGPPGSRPTQYGVIDDFGRPKQAVGLVLDEEQEGIALSSTASISAAEVAAIQLLLDDAWEDLGVIETWPIPQVMVFIRRWPSARQDIQLIVRPDEKFRGAFELQRSGAMVAAEYSLGYTEVQEVSAFAGNRQPVPFSAVSSFWSTVFGETFARPQREFFIKLLNEAWDQKSVWGAR